MEVTIAAVVVLAIATGALALVRRQKPQQKNSSEQPMPTSTEPVASQQSGEVVVLERPDGAPGNLLAMSLAEGDSLLFGADATLERHSATPVAWNSVAQTVPTIANALSRGEIVRVIGPQHLIDGLKTGALQNTVTSTGAIGIVKGPDGKFVGHLRFESASEARVPAKVAGPLLLFQVASAVTMQYYLHQITSRLVEIQRGIDDLKATLRAQSVGAIRTAAAMCEELEGLASHDGHLRSRDHTRLVVADNDVQAVYFGLSEKLRTFAREVEELIGDDGAPRDKNATKDLLKHAPENEVRDALLWVEAMVVRIRIARVRALAEVDATPERAEAIRLTLERQLDEMREAFEGLQVPFGALNLRRDNAGGMEKELEAYRVATKRLRALLRTPVRRALPAPETEQPFIVELRRGREGVESRYALVETTVA